MYFCLHLQYLISLSSLHLFHLKLYSFSGEVFWHGAGMKGTVENKAELHCSKNIKAAQKEVQQHLLNHHCQWQCGLEDGDMRAPLSPPPYPCVMAVVPRESLFLC